MLYKPDVHTKEILDLATFIEELPEGRYHQNEFLDRDGCRCICGWINYLNCHMPANRDAAADYLGINYEQATTLFASHVFQYGEPSTKLVARVLRHLAATGEVNWNDCKRA